MMKLFLMLLSTCLLTSTSLSYAGQTMVGVAANFTKPMKEIVAAFEKETQHKVTLSIASTGKLYAQIKNGAPYEIFFAADQKRPHKLVEDDLAVADSLITYAKGKLVLWSQEKERIQDPSILEDTGLKYLAIANPKTAPYGAASVTVLKNLQQYSSLKGKIVEGQNIGQTFQHISTGNARQGFVALSQVYYNGRITQGSGWIVPAELYDPIEQDAVLLNKGQHNPVALQFLTYLKGEAAKKIIQSYGYDI